MFVGLFVFYTFEMRAASLLWLWVIAVAVLGGRGWGMYTQYSIGGPIDGLFLDRFCYAGNGFGRLTVAVPSSSSYDDLVLAYVDDESVLYPQLQDHRITCDALRAQSTLVPIPSDREVVVDVGGTHGPHFYMFYITQCSAAAMQLDIELHYENGGGFLYDEFSFDQQGVLLVYVMFFAATFLLAALLASFPRLMRPLGMRADRRFWALLAAVALYDVALLFFLVDQLTYASNGVGVPSAAGLGDVLALAAFFAMFLYMVWMLPGRYGDDEPARPAAVPRLLLIVCFAAAAAVYLSLFVWSQLVREYDSYVFAYESVAGFLLLLVRALCDVVLLLQTLSSWPRGRPVVYSLIHSFSFLLAMAWLCLPPIAVLLLYYVSPYYREKFSVFSWEFLTFVLTGALVLHAMPAVRAFQSLNWRRLGGTRDELVPVAAAPEIRDTAEAHQNEL